MTTLTQGGGVRAMLAGLALAACLALAGCFVSDAPLFDPRRGEAVFGKGVVSVVSQQKDQDAETNQLEWSPDGYIDPEDKDADRTSFHHLPGSGWFSPWYVAQSGEKGGGYIYMLYRKRGGRLESYPVSCSDLTDAEAAAAHITRSESGSECKATTAADLAQAFRILSRRLQPDGYLAVAKKPH
ncbi:MAG: hypothetical protein AB7M12_05405 [Hyphomonadaceae bacterium]